MYQVNKITGDIKQSSKLSKGYHEVSEDVYLKLKDLPSETRVLMFTTIDDGDFRNLTAQNLRVGDGNTFESDGKNTATNGGYTGVNNKTGATTFKIDALTGNADFIGDVTAKDASFTNTPTFPGQDGKKSKGATLNDIAQSKAEIKSPKGTVDVGADGTAVTVDIHPATATKLGGVMIPTGGALEIDAQGNLRVNGAISPIKYISLWDASTNTPTLSDATGKPDTFYVVHVAGSQDLGSGKIDFKVGDWALCQEDIGGKQKYVNVPMSEATTAISASMIKAGILGKGIGIDTDQDIKTTAGVTAKTITVENIIVTGSITGTN